jgi:type III secretion protein T
MVSLATYGESKAFIGALVMTQPRIIALCLMIPVFSRQFLPGVLRYALTLAMGVVVAPLLLQRVPAAEMNLLALVPLIVKEVFIGAVLGFLAAIPFWVFQGLGTLIDQQRGASMGAILNPGSGDESTPLALFFSLAFGVFFLVGGGFSLVLAMLYDSFLLWDPWQWTPLLHADAIPVLLGQLDRLMQLVLLLAAPAVVAMLLAEAGLALASRFTPQLQVFFLAMPIKSGLALLVLVLYMTTLFEYGSGLTYATREILPFLARVWQVS